MKKHFTSVLLNKTDPRFSVKKTKIQNICDFVLEHLGLGPIELSVSFMSAEEIQELNSSYRGKDYPTDVLSFPQQVWEKPLFFQKPKPQTKTQKNAGPPQMLGDLIICLEKAEESAINLGHGIDRETAFLLIHGILHLAGHDHETTEEETLMIGEQIKFIDAMTASIASEPLWSQCVCLTGTKL